MKKSEHANLRYSRVKYLGLLTQIFCIFLFSIQMALSNTKIPPLKVVCTFSILSDLVKTIGGDAVIVETIVPINTDPHTYQPTPSNAKSLANADLVFVNGLNFEGWIDRLIAASGYQGNIIIAAQDISPRSAQDLSQDIEKTPTIDPHAWHNVQNAVAYVRVITDALIIRQPQQREKIQARSQEFIHKLQDLDQWIIRQINSIPPEKRIVVTTHDAFWYYGDAYGIQFLSPVGVSTDAQPSAAAMAGLIRQIQQQDIRAVFIENLSNSRLVNQIAKETHVKIGGVLYADSLSEETGPAATYIQMIRHNTAEIINALM